MTVKLYHPVSGQVDLVVSGLSVADLSTPEAVAALIEELRYELESNGLHRRDTSLGTVGFRRRLVIKNTRVFFL